MQLHIRAPKDFWSGLIFVSIGAAALWIGKDYETGMAGAMGPGYFPQALSVLLASIGLILMARSALIDGEEVGRFALGKASLILLSIALFALLVRGAGLVPAIAVLTMVAGYASTRFTVSAYGALAAAMALFCVLVFTQALGLPMQAFGTWFGR